MTDSPRWCDICKKHGDHHTDRHPEEVCGAYFGTGDHGAVCIRQAGHPPFSEDGIGHSDTVRDV